MDNVPRKVLVFAMDLALLAMYCSFLKEKSGTEFSRVSFEHVTRDSVVKFIRWLRDERKCEVSTCNLRLSSLKSLLKYCADADICLCSVYLEVKKVPLMKAPRMPVGHMSDAAFKALLTQPDIRTAKGIRNRMIIMLLYDTGTRVQELVDIKVADLHLEARSPFITVTGKGNKTRNIPLMDKTVSHLKEYVRRFHAGAIDGTNRPLFYSNRSGAPQMLSTDAVSVMLKNYGEAAKRICPEVPERVHPHLIRHTRATHLYRAGMPLSYIAEFLGHASMNTTEIYASASIEMLRGALEKADPEAAQEMPSWKDEESLKKLCGL
ncbi:MAG TPA: tyrosine-type recombinase/integrase [Spirochaetia bacterium]|nr:tyrosine-type recombinase/integrase [Spirochaetia bacterium]